MNNIGLEQNKNSNLKLLYMKKIFYDRANIAEIVTVLCSLFFIVISIIVEDSKFLLISSILLVFINAFLSYYQNKCYYKATAYMDMFSSNVLGTKMNETYPDSFLEYMNETIIKKEKKFISIISKTGIDGGLKDYFDVNIQGLSKENAAFKCQKESIYYDNVILEAILKICSTSVIALLLFLVFNNKKELFEIVLCLMPLLEILIMNVINSVKKIIKYRDLKLYLQSISDSKKILMKNINRIEKYLFEIRKIPCSMFSIIYLLKRKKIHKNINKIL